MGADLVLEFGDLKEVSIGRSYNYEIFLNYKAHNVIQLNLEEEFTSCLTDLKVLVAYNPKSKEELDGIVSEVEAKMWHLFDYLIEGGKSLLLVMLQDEGVKIREEG